MAADLENKIQEKVKALPVEQQQRALSLVEAMRDERTDIWSLVAELYEMLMESPFEGEGPEKKIAQTQGPARPGRG